MKKNLHLLLLLVLSIEGYGQIININASADAESSYDPEQLIENILISSKCSTVSSFSYQVSGDPDDLTTKSYGYFKKPRGSSFPFDEGIIITSGRAFPAGNTLNNERIDFDNGLSRDRDLETALRSSAYNASFIKFNFIPAVNTISFRFLMASEEYDGATECSFADGFAFLLREKGTTDYINLAVLPDGKPVSVRNINNSSLINNQPGESNCDANIDLFEGYNIRDTNYDGRTKVLTATSRVVPNTEYEIKIVVADQGDSAWDSAIFLEAGSFNIGGSLGPDRTVATRNPACIGKPLILDATIGLQGTTYTWYKDRLRINGVTGPTYSPTTSGTYRVDIDIARGCTSSDEIVIEFVENPIIAELPKNIILCDNDGDSVEVFDFTENQNLVLGSQLSTISFHRSFDEANSNERPIATPNAYSNISQTETIWVRIADRSQTCFEVESFNISVFQKYAANLILDYELCDDNSDGNDSNGSTTFDLSTKKNEILGSQLNTDFNVTFYYTQTEAENGMTGTEIVNPIQNTNNPSLIFARIENVQDSSCYTTTSFNLIVNPLPIVNANVTLTQCDDNTDGFSNFNLTEANQLISTNHLNETFSYYLTNADANSGITTNQITDFINYPNPTALNSIVFARVESDKGCYRTVSIDLVVSATQIPSSFNLVYEVCDDKLIDNDNTNGITSFNFSDAEQKVKDIFPNAGQNLTVTFYTNESDALAEINAISNISNHRNDTSPNIQQIYVRVDSDIINACLGLGNHINLIVKPLPLSNPISDYILCSDTDFTAFNLPTKTSEIIGSQTNPILVSYHLSEQDAIDNIEITNSSQYLNISNPQTIFARVQFDENGNGFGDLDECYSTDMSFNLIVNYNPVIFSPDIISICNDQIPTTYDLTVRENQITGGDSSIVLTYFESQLDLDTNNPISDPTLYQNTLLNKDILVLATGINACTTTTKLSLNTILYANLNASPTPIEECEIDNNGFDFFDITRRETEILNGLDALDFSFTYYENETDAMEGNPNSISNITNFENTQNTTQKIFVRVLPITNECFIVVPINLIVNPVPEIGIEKEYVICLNNNNEIINPENTTFLKTPPIDTKLNDTEYTFQWYKGTELEVNTDPISTVISGATNAQYMPESIGNYTVFATNINTGCRIPASTSVVGSYPPESISVKLSSTAFSGNNTIEVEVSGIGEYEYKLDSNSWQNSNTFERLTGGEHIIYVRDLLNCNEISEVQIVIDYPKYFTPNGDGVHDTWNIKGIVTQPRSEIYIYDRYGKLIKQVNPSGIGWDGTFNGNKLPSGDYWFIVKYNEPSDGTQKEFRSHFSLKR